MAGKHGVDLISKSWNSVDTNRYWSMALARRQSTIKPNRTDARSPVHPNFLAFNPPCTVKRFSLFTWL
ncbi:MAG: hypothetical protein DMF00_06995 [Verrucomicrobia bacterium]|nr:MAG: hypothetical protein DMF00_06995 [Verrucomicrobiota bacterium]